MKRVVLLVLVTMTMLGIFIQEGLADHRQGQVASAAGTSTGQDVVISSAPAGLSSESVVALVFVGIVITAGGISWLLCPRSKQDD